MSRGNVASLAPVFSVHLPEIADGAPVLAAAVPTSSGTRDLLFVTTKAGRVVALDARTGATVWSTTPPSGPNYTTSSPALDPSRQFVYGYALDGFVHKYGIADGERGHDGRLAGADDAEARRREGIARAWVRDGWRPDLPVHAERRVSRRPGRLSGARHGDSALRRLAEGLQRQLQRSDDSLRRKRGSQRLSARAVRRVGAPRRRLRRPNGPHLRRDRQRRLRRQRGRPRLGRHRLRDHPDGAGSGGNPLDTYTPTELSST